MHASPFLKVPHVERIASNKSAFAIWDRFPASPGHALVVPHRLISTWWEASEEERSDLFGLVEVVREIVSERHDPDGYNIGINIGKAGGQTIDHLHVHVIPRYSGDMPDPRGGVRHVIPSKGNYLIDSDPGRSPVLLDGLDDGQLLLELFRCLDNPIFDRIDMVVSFIMNSGLRLIADRLEYAIQRGARVRILTTDYLHVTDPDALTRLLDMVDADDDLMQVRVFHDPSLSFHPKAYLFWSGSGEMAAGYVGSSNLSRSGISGGVEWNLGVERVAPLVTSFERLWDDRRSNPLSHEWLRRYRQDRPSSIAGDASTAGVADEPLLQPVSPRPIQQEALSALEGTRVDGFNRGLVVMATGLGKTWLAAFDSSRPQFKRVLFIAHREEILRQARDVFRQVRPDADLGLFLGSDKAPNADVVFASIQPLSRHLEHFSTDRFDYVVVDEFHHAAAPTYRRVIDHFTPSFLLGLTATPDRRDGADLLVLCGDNLVFECNLVEGIRRDELSPFEYWGIKDVADFAPIPWRNGRFDPEALTTAIETRDRAEQALTQWRQKGGGPTLAFCASISHAEFMKGYFTDSGVLVAAVHSGPQSDPRHRAVEELRSGTVEVVFTVDVFNEGVDIPEILSVLMLRPTESPVVFLQQLGRGLRKAEGKEALQVIDFVGNHRSFLMKPRTLLSLGTRTPSNKEALQAIRTGDLELPPGCSVNFDLEAIELLESLVPRSRAEALEEFCTNYAADHGVRPTAAQAFRSGYNPAAKAVRDAGGWHLYLDGFNQLNVEEQAVTKLHGPVLEGLATERVTRSYKLVTFKALLRLGALHTGAPVADIAAASLAIIRSDPRLRADATTQEMPDLDNVTERGWERYWLKWPITHLSDKADSLFRIRDDRLEPTYLVSAEQSAAFASMAAEIVEWRLLQYLLGSGATSEIGDIVLRVSHSSGKPIIRFDRSRQPDIPDGETEFTADGRTHTGIFVKIALNVTSTPGERGNSLHGLLRGWFGPDVGLPGTNHQVVLSQTGASWAMRPLEQPDARSSDAVRLFPSFAVACGALASPSDQPTEQASLLLSGTTGLEIERVFVIFAEGDSMDGGTDPIKSGDPLLFESAHDQRLVDLEGQRVLVETTDSGQRVAGLKRLTRVEARGWRLDSDNAEFSSLDADSKMHVTARLIRKLTQHDLNALAVHIGESFKRADVPTLYGQEFNVGNWNTGHVSLAQDTVLFVTLEKGDEMTLGSDYRDGFESPSIFVWSSQNSVGPDSKKGKEILDAPRLGTRIHLWARRKKSTVAFEYCGLVIPIDHQGNRPMSVRFRLLTPLSGEAMARLQPRQE
ncbi:MAG: DUF3427 domain-containing protein [Gemmatimonadales bacterium]|nr:DUF3427 domain-containing protein [Gemmatimonadales bacterium]